MSLYFHEGVVENVPDDTERLDAKGGGWYAVFRYSYGRPRVWLNSGHSPTVARAHVRAAARSNPGHIILVMWARNHQGDIELGFLRSRDFQLVESGTLEPPEWLKRLDEEDKGKVSSFWSRLGGVDFQK